MEWEGHVAVQSSSEGVELLPVQRGLHVVLLDFAPVYVHGLALGLQEAGIDCSVIGSTAALHEGLNRPRLHGPLDSAALVVVLPHHDAVQLTATSLPSTVALHVVHVLPDASATTWSDALAAGATGAFELSAELSQVLLTVQCAAAGYCMLPPAVAQALGRTRRGAAPVLETSERRYLRSLADGGAVADLARQSGYSEREMYRLLSSVYARIGARNRTEALLSAERFGLLEEET